MTLHKLLTLSIQYNRECLKLTQKYLYNSSNSPVSWFLLGWWYASNTQVLAHHGSSPQTLLTFGSISFTSSGFYLLLPLPSILPSLHSPFIRMHLIKLLCRSQSSSEDYLNWSRVFQIFKIKFPDWAASFSAPYLFYQYSPVNFQQYLQIWGKLLWKENI